MTLLLEIADILKAAVKSIIELETLQKENEAGSPASFFLVCALLHDGKVRLKSP